MKANDIRVGDTLQLKPDNPYGFGPLVLTVSRVTYKPGYRTPWIHVEGVGAFRPSDFAKRV